MEGAPQPYDDAASQLCPLNICPSEAEAQKMSLCDIQGSQYPSLSFVASEPIHRQERLRNDNLASIQGLNRYSTTNHKRDFNRPSQQKLRDKMTHHGANAIIGVRRPFTRAQARQRPTLHCPADLNNHKLRKNLTMKEKRKLREFKSQNWTLRQIRSFYGSFGWKSSFLSDAPDREQSQRQLSN
ncbi:hypothetical protein N7486_005016 [Penicillium sp. IBT 16267x]|nr:hypothetical protein N7486_005016 [Penicillium sp. IBT 16267x]